MTTLGAWLRDAAERLAPVTDTPRLDAELLLAHALGLSRAKLLASLRDEAQRLSRAEEFLARRANHEPIAYILGEWEFYSLTFKVHAPMLVPRPETEHLVEAALEHLGQRPGRVLDLCTGTGCVALAIAHNAPRAKVEATDINPDAVQLAEENAEALGLMLTTREGDLFAALPNDTAPFDVIVSNPPYVPDDDWATLSPVITRHEDPRALLGGDDGLDLVRRIIHAAPAHLHTGGLLALEIGEGQAGAVVELMQNAGFREARTRKDLQGIDRIVQGLA